MKISSNQNGREQTYRGYAIAVLVLAMWVDKKDYKIQEQRIIPTDTDSEPDGISTR